MLDNPGDKRLALDCVATTLRDVRSLSEFIGAVKVGAGIANDMLDDLEHRLLDCIEQIGRE